MSLPAASFYANQLYPLQDVVLSAINSLDTGFYLTGGTAISRGYLHHRYSDDLDLFVNDKPEFRLWSARIIDGLAARSDWPVQVQVAELRFTRLTIVAKDVPLRIELINDVPAHVGAIVPHPVLGRLDSAENILANKVTAVFDRNEPKDLADIWGLCTRLRLSLRAALVDATSKAAGIFPADLARVLCSATEQDWALVRWSQPPPLAHFLDDLRRLGEEFTLVAVMFSP